MAGCGPTPAPPPFSRSLGGTSLTDPTVVSRYSVATSQLLSDGLFTHAYAEALRAAFGPKEQ